MLLLLSLPLSASGCASALREPPSPAVLAGREAGEPAEAADQLLAEARKAFATRQVDEARRAATLFSRAAAADPARVEAFAGAARTRIWLADHESAAAARERLAVEAVQSAQLCRRAAPDDPACTYWLAAALGIQARERPATGLDALPRIERLFQEAARAAPLLDHAGPDRALALFYVRAPGWPTGPGDPDEGLAHARRAVELAPKYAPNLLALGEALAATGAREEARAAYRRALQLARAASARGDEPEAAQWVTKAERGLHETSAR